MLVLYVPENIYKDDRMAHTPHSFLHKIGRQKKINGRRAFSGITFLKKCIYITR